MGEVDLGAVINGLILRLCGLVGIAAQLPRLAGLYQPYLQLRKQRSGRRETVKPQARQENLD